ncbi:MAG: protein phosphatase 2C domain-containing protein [Bacteroidales bacterium]|nr:protein phosphatase 2C domain-containing protein [Bacteroidales bacterium]
MEKIKFIMAAKTDVGLERTNNEDNFQVTSNLEDNQWTWLNDEQCTLSEKGILLAVADGMGGMNAGEVASEIAINTIKDYFKEDKLTKDVLKNTDSINKYMKTAIVAADLCIKQAGHHNPNLSGMGTTIVLAWIIKDNLYIAWCGDSRAYVYNPEIGLNQLSKDHSYVQNLVDEGKLSKENAFDHPNSNIITRSLGDVNHTAVPDCLSTPYKLCKDDIVMLCTDGLSGMIRDEQIQSIIEENQSSMSNCIDALIQGAYGGGGADNITIALCKILTDTGNKPVVLKQTASVKQPKKSKVKLWVILACLVGVLVGLAVGYIYFSQMSAPKEPSKPLQEKTNTATKHFGHTKEANSTDRKNTSVKTADKQKLNTANKQKTVTSGKSATKVAKPASVNTDNNTENASQQENTSKTVIPVPATKKVTTTVQQGATQNTNKKTTTPVKKKQ